MKEKLIERRWKRSFKMIIMIIIDLIYLFFFCIIFIKFYNKNEKSLWFLIIFKHYMLKIIFFLKIYFKLCIWYSSDLRKLTKKGYFKIYKIGYLENIETSGNSWCNSKISFAKIFLTFHFINKKTLSNQEPCMIIML